MEPQWWKSGTPSTPEAVKSTVLHHQNIQFYVIQKDILGVHTIDSILLKDGLLVLLELSHTRMPVTWYLLSMLVKSGPYLA